MAGTALGWIVGVILALASLGSLMTDLLAGVLYLVAAAIVLPPVNAWLKDKVSLVMSWKVKAWLVLALFVAANAPTRGEKREAARAAAARADTLRADFRTNGPAILRRLDSALTVRNYTLAASIGQKYVGSVTDPQLAKLYTQAQAGQKRDANRVRERQLLARASSIASSDLEGNRDLYQQLMAVNPNEPAYKRKYDDYNNRIRQRDAAEQDRIRRFGRAPQASAWDGTYREVDDYLTKLMNDPESLKMDGCTKVYHVDSGWLVGCDYRGRNAFGGMIRQSNWFIIRQGRVVQMLDATAYRP